MNNLYGKINLYKIFFYSPYQVKIILKILLIVCTLWHDMVQGTIITSYCLQGQLLIAHLYFLRGKLLQHTLPPIDWMKEISEFKKLLKYFNNDLGPAVSIYTVINLSWATAGTIWLLQYNDDETENNPVTYIGIINVVLWILISIVPFIQAARLTTACSMIQSIGHEVRIRPFVYESTPGEDLDTILLYTSSLKMCARLFRIPVTSRYLCLLLTVASIAILTLDTYLFIYILNVTLKSIRNKNNIDSYLSLSILLQVNISHLIIYIVNTSINFNIMLLGCSFENDLMFVIFLFISLSFFVNAKKRLFYWNGVFNILAAYNELCFCMNIILNLEDMSKILAVFVNYMILLCMINLIY
ncbi:nucleolar protein 10-like [Vespula squamosa]|uniref:Nucleolar protein 10-like n=1 Tax=Vespula squamosa TaxID=30214 RepID=A0ABD2AI39_VESSQ